jgi:NAD(P)-dependent dehydrogenase (short-subunit alcohol dehydrogenase family)
VSILLVTGASRGIGAAIARLAGARGYDVAVNYLRDEKAAQAVAQDVRAAGRRAVAVQADMAREADIERMFAAIDKELGRLTHLVYNAGTTGGNSRVEAVEAKTIRDTMELNAVGALLCAKAAILRMSKKHGGAGGAMVLISSMAASLGSPGEYVWYAASKGAIDSMTIGLSKELAGDGIRVNAVSPGVILTDIHPPGRVERITPSVPLQRAGKAEEVAETVLFLLSEASSYTTGTNVRVAGGR